MECSMYIISHRQVDGKKIFFGECVEDGFYYENEDYYNVSKKNEGTYWNKGAEQ